MTSRSEDDELSATAAESLGTAEATGRPTSGLASLAGALADWDDLDEVTAEIYAARRQSADRPPPDLYLLPSSSRRAI